MAATGQKERKHCDSKHFSVLSQDIHIQSWEHCSTNTLFKPQKYPLLDEKIVPEYVGVHYLWDLQILGGEGNKSFLYLLQKQRSNIFLRAWKVFWCLGVLQEMAETGDAFSPAGVGLNFRGVFPFLLLSSVTWTTGALRLCQTRTSSYFKTLLSRR